MRMQQNLLSAADETEEAQAYCLTQLEVFNWGPFCGLHRVEFDAAGCALIGQTGSGKTTLVDAIMTVICTQPRYNLASTGGHESDRDLMSYLRGVTGTGGEDETLHIARPTQTTTGISVTLSQGDKRVRLSALLWLDSSSTSLTDMKRLWLFDQSPGQGLSDHLSALKELGARGIKRQLKEQQGMMITDNKKSYLAQCRRFFEVGENAFVLLNRAAGLKQLNSIDELFRELVLDNRSAFNRAHEVTTEFDELKGIHAELETARQQQQSLIPIDKAYRKHQGIALKLSELNEINRLLPRWFAYFSGLLWAQQLDALEQEISGLQSKRVQAQKMHAQQQQISENLYLDYQQLGGANIEETKRQISEQQREQDQLKQNINDYQQLCRTLKLAQHIESKQLVENKQLATAQLTQVDERLQKMEAERDTLTQKTLNAEDRLKTVNADIREALSAPDSNIPSEFLRFQKMLADELDLTPEQIPYIGQCVEVHDTSWQGAIERAIGSHRLRLVVANDNMKSALDWINLRNNQLHVRLLNSADYQQHKMPLDNGFCHKLRFKENDHHQTIQNFLASIDRHCVESTQQLRDTPYGLTEQGLMSGKQGLFEKQDQRRLNEGWMTGFDNQSRLNELKSQLDYCKLQAEQNRSQLEVVKTSQQHLNQQRILYQELLTLDFTQLDISGTQSILEQLALRLSELQSPDSDTAKAEKRWQDAKQQLQQWQIKINEYDVDLQVAEKSKKQADKERQSAEQRQQGLLTEAQIEVVAKQYEKPEAAQLDKLSDLEREAMQDSQHKISNQTGRRNSLESDLVRLMVKALQADTGALSETGSGLEDIDAYLQQLVRLTKEDLPNKLDRFLLYLNQSSDQGVTQLLTRIDNEVSVIEERIEELNATLRGVDFQLGRYLQLMPQKVTHESLQTLMKARKNLRSAELQDDQGESHYKALMILIQLLREAVDRKRTRPAQALLDPRYRLQFSVAVIDRNSGKVLETRTGSKGGSGGEKEIIASFILTASLSYALCPKNRKTPLFGTVILDEAFSKSSQAVAARIISALREFGLHPLFVTPNKEMRLLRAHTSSAVLVHRRLQESRALSLSWQDIDKHLTQRDGQ